MKHAVPSGYPDSPTLADCCRLCPSPTTSGQSSALTSSPFPEKLPDIPKSSMNSNHDKLQSWASHFSSLGPRSLICKMGFKERENENDFEYSKFPPTSDFLGATEIWNSTQGYQDIPLVGFSLL